MGAKNVLLCITILIFALAQKPVFAAKKSYIVYLGAHSHGPEVSLEVYEQAKHSHYDLLGSCIGSKEKARDAIVYSYTKNINGFAAILEEEEARELAKHPGVVSVFENKLSKLHTTHSWEFLAVEMANKYPIWTNAKFGADVIIANLDTGVWPESKSFSDEGIGPVPKRWRGYCENNTRAGVPCNRKLIGARYFNKGIRSWYPNITLSNTARDVDGHGSHTLSTAAGRFVPGAQMFGAANGTAKGGSPDARVATYKVCWADSCADADILAGFEAAIHDGVDVISVSLGVDPLFMSSNYLEDSVALGSLHATARGITVVCSAGNSGPDLSTVTNYAPWVTTVGASTTDREFVTYLTLGEKKQIKGTSLQQKVLPQNKLYPLINAFDAPAANVPAEIAGWCNASSLDHRKVNGKIVICKRGGEISRLEKGMAVLQAGGVGMILVNDDESGSTLIADPHILPSTMISYRDGFVLASYMNQTKHPLGSISPGVTKVGKKPAPMMAEFSSQGPSFLSPEILKPDITAPGVEILAAFTEAISPTGTDFDKRRVPYALMSGTSMACPHVSGVSGLLKVIHPDWSPAAIRSAIMTTARTRDNTGASIKDHAKVKATPFATGSGYLRPNRAVNPGLVYDTTFADYLNFLCTLGYNSSALRNLTHESFTCPSKHVRLEDLNYPSISVPTLNGSLTVTRTVKNVGQPGLYKATVVAPFGITVAVNPTILKFDKVGEEKVFKVSFKTQKERSGRGFVFGRLTWSDGKHFVRSPLVVNAIA
ncbi:subtilisin-like protease SBT5.3 [Typha latifolia]|uniref:subtilisin-like protease SBT5.3 n=1 Tax=Typha latifolia TaxID=4733 RepID=UPI003C2C10E1